MLLHLVEQRAASPSSYKKIRSQQGFFLRFIFFFLFEESNATTWGVVIRKKTRGRTAQGMTEKLECEMIVREGTEAHRGEEILVTL